MSAQPDQLFLTEEQTDDFTDIRRGTGGKTKYALQVEYLRKSGIAHFVSARGRPRIPVSVIEGRKTEPVRQVWQPRIA